MKIRLMTCLAAAALVTCICTSSRVFSESREAYTITDLGTLGGAYSHAAGLSASGQVVGRAWTAGDAEFHAFLWQDGVMHDLGTLGGTWSYASAINESSQVVGSAATGRGDQRAFLWRDGVMNDLGTRTGSRSARRARRTGHLAVVSSTWASMVSAAAGWVTRSSPSSEVPASGTSTSAGRLPPRSICRAGAQTLTMWAAGGYYNVRHMRFTLVETH